MHSWHKALFGFVCCIFLAVPAFAQSNDDGGDAAHGRVLYNGCVGCHGVPTYHYPYPHYNVPKLGGQHAQYIQSALKEYAADKRDNPTMHAQAASLSEQDYKDLAAFLSQPEP